MLSMKEKEKEAEEERRRQVKIVRLHLEYIDLCYIIQKMSLFIGKKVIGKE